MWMIIQWKINCLHAFGLWRGEKSQTLRHCLGSCVKKKKRFNVCVSGFLFVFVGFFYDSELSSWCGMSFQGKKKKSVGQRSSDYSDAKVNIKYAVQ